MFFTEIKYQPEKGGCYLGSPSIVRLTDGALLVSHDYFGRGAPRGDAGENGLTSVYRSEDNGATWHNISHVMNLFWPSLFTHNDAVWLLGCSHEYGSIVIRRSDDGGFSWTHPTDARNGMLFASGPGRECPNYHCAPVPVVVHHGRIYRAFEDNATGAWPSGFHSCVISAPVNANLLDATSWTMSNKLSFKQTWIPDRKQYEQSSYGNRGWGWLEGNIVITPDDRLVNILRLHAPLKKWPGHEDSDTDIGFNQERADACEDSDQAAVVEVSANGSRLRFNPDKGRIYFPGGGIGKFTIRRDPITGMYLSIVNRTSDTATKFKFWRNVLSLAVSADLYHWRIACKLLEDDSGLSSADSRSLSGFQYVDWIFDGDDLLFAARTAYRGAHSAHDSNRITFHRLNDFRDRIK